MTLSLAEINLLKKKVERLEKEKKELLEWLERQEELADKAHRTHRKKQNKSLYMIAGGEIVAYQSTINFIESQNTENG